MSLAAAANASTTDFARVELVAGSSRAASRTARSVTSSLEATAGPIRATSDVARASGSASAAILVITPAIRVRTSIGPWSLAGFKGFTGMEAEATRWKLDLDDAGQQGAMALALLRSSLLSRSLEGFSSLVARRALATPAVWSSTTPGQHQSSGAADAGSPSAESRAEREARLRAMREGAFSHPDVTGGPFVSATPPTSDVFYVPTVLTARQRQVYESVSVSKAGLADHGFLYGLTEADLAGRSEHVRRALSTRTGSTHDQLSFRRSEIVRKYGANAADTGASRVQVSKQQGACLAPPEPSCGDLPCCCPASQVAILTERINRLSTHLGKNRHDKHSKRSLGLLTVQRRHLLEYMMRRDYANYVRRRRGRKGGGQGRRRRTPGYLPLSPPPSQRLMVSELGLRQLPVFHSRHLPKVRERTHAQVKERNMRLRSRVSRGHLGH